MDCRHPDHQEDQDCRDRAVGCHPDCTCCLQINPEYGSTGQFKVTATGEIVSIIFWSRPYGMPYGHTSDGREFHLFELEMLPG